MLLRAHNPGVTLFSIGRDTFRSCHILVWMCVLGFRIVLTASMIFTVFFPSSQLSYLHVKLTDMTLMELGLVIIIPCRRARGPATLNH